MRFPVLAAVFMTACSTGGSGTTTPTDAGPLVYVAAPGYVTCPIDAGTPASICHDLPDGDYPPCSSAASGTACAPDAGEQCISCSGEAYDVACVCGGEAGVWNCQTCAIPPHSEPAGGP